MTVAHLPIHIAQDPPLSGRAARAPSTLQAIEPILQWPRVVRSDSGEKRESRASGKEERAQQGESSTENAAPKAWPGSTKKKEGTHLHGRTPVIACNAFWPPPTSVWLSVCPAAASFWA